MSHAAGPTNRLARESSPYLLLHQRNPVDWYPWGPEALARARAEDRPIFLSVGYSTCYWCHVMERESFSNPEIAALLNQHFVSIKLDREERPDLDEIYMAATQILTGQGGWPNSVFLTPDLRPFYAGTYFPPEERYGRPGFGSLVLALADAWRNRRAELLDHAEELARSMRRVLEERSRPGERPPGPEVARRSFEALSRRFDREWGGFGGAPKFPTPSNLYLLQELAPEEPQAAAMLATTLDRMARGGLYDQIGGGFHRYSTDREWRVPHFEKMLYDNGFLLEIYAREHARTGEAEWGRVARETAAFLAREMTSPEGAFLSAIDAETDGKEGAYYAWSRDELAAVLGGEDSQFLAPIFGFEGSPFFEGDHYVLHLPRPLAEQAAARRMSREELLAELAPLAARLLAARDRRQRPLTDDKVLADWNGIAIAGMVAAGEALGDRSPVERAARAARFVLGRMRPPGGPLAHSYRAGQAKTGAFLADYAFLVRGLLALDRAGAPGAWLGAARELTDEQIRRLRAPQGGFFVAAPSTDLLFRTQEVFDGATPAANAVAVENLIALAERTGEGRWRQEAAAALQAFAPLAEQHPEAVRMLTLAARRYARLEPGRPPAAQEAPAAAAAGARAGSLRAEGASETGQARSLPSSVEAAAIENPEALARKTVTAALHLEAQAEKATGWRSFTVRLSIQPGWHVNANPASGEYLIPTSLAADRAELAEVAYPPGRLAKLAFADEPLSVYQGQVALTGQVRPGAEQDSALSLTYQACDESRCLPPVTIRLPLAAP